MNIDIKAKGIDLTTAIREYVELRLKPLERFITSDDHVYVEVGKTTNHHKHGLIYKAECNATVRGKKHFVSADNADLYGAIDDMKDELTRNLMGKRDRAMALFRRGSQRIKKLLRLE